jgi:hypothetical protein
MDLSLCLPPVIDRNFHQDIVDVPFGIFDVAIKIAVILEDAGIK